MKIVLPDVLDQTSITNDWWQTLSASERSDISAAKTLIMDLHKVKRLDTAGLAWLINAVRDAKANNLVLTMENLPAKLLQLARVSGVDTLLPITQTHQ